MLHRNTAMFRFYAELNDFLPPERRQRSFTYAFQGTPAIKDAIEALGVPHTEVDLILINGESVDFEYRLQSGDRVAVYPVFETLDITPLTRVREVPLRRTKFILDGHLGKLARLLRLLGFDTYYDNTIRDNDLIAIAQAEQRIILTRDLGLLKRKVVTHGYWVRSSEPIVQAREIMRHFDLYHQARPFTRCLKCNGKLTSVVKSTVAHRLPPHVRQMHNSFLICTQCGQVYWPGSHFNQLKLRVNQILDDRPQGTKDRGRTDK